MASLRNRLSCGALWRAAPPQIDDSRFCDAVVEEEFLTIEESPDESQGEQGESCARDDVARNRLRRPEGAALAALEFEPPRLHRERLTAARPLHDEIDAGDEQQ